MFNYGTHPKTPSDVVVCTYAICKNELKFVDSWLTNIWNNGSGSDYICILDTGSTDGTYETLIQKAASLNIPQDHFIISQKTVTPWRFDVARNLSLSLCPSPSQIDVLYCIDLDEQVIPEFWSDLRQIVFDHPDFTRIFYKYAWSHYDDGTPKWSFWYDKIHGVTGWSWKYPVHESLTCATPEIYSNTYNMDSSKTYLHHYPDQTKSRSSYLSLLKLRAEEYPDDLYGLFYLMREYSFIADYEHAIEVGSRLITRLLKNSPSAHELAVRDDMNMLPSALNAVGTFYRKLDINDIAEFYFIKSINTNPALRDGYISLAQMYAYTNQPDKAISLINTMLKKTVKLDDWRFSTICWRDWKVNQILADAYMWKGIYPLAQYYMNLALNSLTTQDDINDAKYEGLFDDNQFLINALHKENL